MFSRRCSSEASPILLPKTDSVLRRDAGKVEIIVPKSLEASPDDEYVLPDDFKNPGVLSLVHASTGMVYRRDNEEKPEELSLRAVRPLPVDPSPEADELLAQSTSALPDRIVNGKVIHQPAPGIFRREQRPGPEKYDNMPYNTGPIYNVSPPGSNEDLQELNNDIVVIHQPVSDIYRRDQIEGSQSPEEVNSPSGPYPGSVTTDPTEPTELSHAADIETHQPARGIYQRNDLTNPAKRSEKRKLDLDWKPHLGHGPVVPPSLLEHKRSPNPIHHDVVSDAENWESHIQLPEPLNEKRDANPIPPPEYFDDLLPSPDTHPSPLNERDGGIVKRVNFDKDHPMDRPALVHSLSKAVYRRASTDEMDPKYAEIKVDEVDNFDRPGTNATPAQIHQSKNSVWRRGEVVIGV